MEWEDYNWRHDDMTLAVFQECLIFLGITVFIMSQPENPWSLDRGMNGISF